MIAPLRNTHRRTFTLLAVLVPVVLAMGVAARHPSPAQPKRTGVELRSAADRFSVLVSPDRRVSVRIQKPVPDPRLYWSSTAPTNDVPATAVFIGPADPNAAYDLPRDAGHLVLYSGGHARIVDYLHLETRP